MSQIDVLKVVIGREVDDGNETNRKYCGSIW